MQFSDMTEGRFTGKTPTQVSSGNSKPPDPDRPANTPPYRVSEAAPAKIEVLEPQNVYLPYGKQHAEAHGCRIALTLEQALKFREEGVWAVSMREADIAARGSIPLNKEFLQHGLRAIGGFLTEGIPGEDGNGWVLREFYNRGMTFKKDGSYDKSPPERRAKADQAIADTLVKLEQLGIPAWPEEIEKGFAHELTKPEFMDWAQYTKAKQQVVKRLSTAMPLLAEQVEQEVA